MLSLRNKGGRYWRLVFIICFAGCCLIIPPRTFSHETLTTTVLFDREIVRILNKHCVMCHVENGPSFPLETYEQTWLQGRKIRADVIARHMPPWAAVPKRKSMNSHSTAPGGVPIAPETGRPGVTSHKA